MSSTQLKLEVIMAAVDKLTGPMRAVMESSKTTSTEVKALRDRIKELNQQSGKVEGFRTLQSQTAVVGHNMAQAQEKVKKLAQEIAATENPTKKMQKAFEAAKREAKDLSTQHTEMTQRVQRQRDALNAAGLATTELASHQRRLKTEVQSTTAALDAEQKKLDGINQRAKQMHAARATYDKATAQQAKLATSGAVGVGTGGAIMFGLGHTIDQASHYQKDMLRIKALGMGDHVVQDSDKFARGMHKYGTSMRDNIDLMRDGLTIFADLHHAEMAVPVMQKMKFANAALFGEKGNEKTDQLYDMLKVVELRGGAKDAKTFEAEANLIQKVMSSTGGRVGSKDYREFIQTGGVASKQLNTDTFYNVMEPLIQEMGGFQVGTGLMSAFQNMYLGKSTTSAARTMGDLGLLKKDMVEYDKIGQIKRMKVGAIIGSETYKTNPFEWLETHFLPALAKKGITDPSAVRDMLATVMGSRTGAKVFTTYLDQRDIINKAAGRNRGAAGIDDTYAIAMESADGKRAALAKRMDDVQQLLGEKLLPVYSTMLDVIHSITNGVANFAEAFPSLVKWLGYTAATVGAVLVVFGGLALVVAALLGPFALLNVAMAAMGLPMITASLLLGKLSAGLMWVWRVGTFLITKNPVVAAIVGITGAVMHLMGRWDELKAMFNAGQWAALGLAILQGLEAGLNAATLGVYSIIKGIAVGLWTAFKSVLGINSPSKVFTELGGFIVDGLINGLTNKLAALKDTVVGVATSAAAWFREKLGIKSPSRVFAEIGGHVMDGLSMGFDNNEDGPLGRVNSLAKKMAAMGAGITIGASAMAVPIDHRAPLSVAGASSAGGGDTIIQITVNPSAGMDETALAKLVAQEVDRITRQAAVAKRSRFTDAD